MAHESIPPQQIAHPQQKHSVYIVQCADGSLYTGYSTDVHKRVARHNAGKGARYTRSRLPVTLLVSWSYPSKGDALRAERALKKLPRIHKLRLIEQSTLEQQARGTFLYQGGVSPHDGSPG